MKYKIKYVHSRKPIKTFLFWTIDWINIDYWYVLSKKHWWNRWHLVKKFYSEREAKEYINNHYNL